MLRKKNSIFIPFHPVLLALSLSALSTASLAGNGITATTADTTGTPVGVKGIADGFIIGGGTINSIGVEGVSTSNTGTGVKGTGGTYGVYGISTAGSLFDPAYGVYGKGDSFSYGVYSDGAAYVKGALTVTADTTVTNISASGDLTVAGAVNNSNAADNPVCADSNGKLGPCNSLNYSSKVAYVGDGPGTYPNILGALAWSGSWCGTPTYSNRCVIKVSPGTHDLGTTSFTLLDFFTIEGEGPDETILTASASQTVHINGNTGVILRDLKIDSTHTGSLRKLLRINNSSDIRIENVQVYTGSGAPTVGIDITNSDVAMKDVRINLSTLGSDTATGIKVSTTLPQTITLDNVWIQPYSFGGATTIGVETNEGIKIKDLHVTSDATYGILSHWGNTVVRHSFINAYNESLRTDNASASIKARFSELSNTTNAVSGTISCTAVTRGNNFYTTTCP